MGKKLLRIFIVLLFLFVSLGVIFFPFAGKTNAVYSGQTCNPPLQPGQEPTGEFHQIDFSPGPNQLCDTGLTCTNHICHGTCPPGQYCTYGQDTCITESANCSRPGYCLGGRCVGTCAPSNCSTPNSCVDGICRAPAVSTPPSGEVGGDGDNEGGGQGNPTPTPIACTSSGVAKVVLSNTESCQTQVQGGASTTATIFCNDGFQTQAPVGSCMSLTDWQPIAQKTCIGHTTCPTTTTPSPSPTPSPTTIASSPTPTLPTTCDPDKTGASLNKIDNADFAWWQAELIGITRTTKASDCISNNIIDIFDFNKMRDLRIFYGGWGGF